VQVYYNDPTTTSGIINTKTGLNLGGLASTNQFSNTGVVIGPSGSSTLGQFNP
jgi:hypothetical protein